MAKLHVLYDPKDLVMMNPVAEKAIGAKSAHLAIPEDLEMVDIYNLARRLAELLLEQL